MTSFSTTLREILTRKNLKQTHLGARAGMFQTEIGRILRGGRTPGLQVTYRLAAGLGLRFNTKEAEEFFEAAGHSLTDGSVILTLLKQPEKYSNRFIVEALCDLSLMDLTRMQEELLQVTRRIRQGQQDPAVLDHLNSLYAGIVHAKVAADMLQLHMEGERLIRESQKK